MVRIRDIMRMQKKNPKKEIHLKLIGKSYENFSQGAIGKDDKNHDHVDENDRRMVRVKFKDTYWYFYPKELQFTDEPITTLCKLSKPKKQPKKKKLNLNINILSKKLKSTIKKMKTITSQPTKESIETFLKTYNIISEPKLQVGNNAKVINFSSNYVSDGAVCKLNKMIDNNGGNLFWLCDFKDRKDVIIHKNHLEPTDEPMTNAILISPEPKLGDHFELTNPNGDIAEKGSIGELKEKNTDNDEDIYRLKYKDGQTELFLKEKLTKTDKPITTQRPSTDKPKPDPNRIIGHAFIDGDLNNHSPTCSKCKEQQDTQKEKIKPSQFGTFHFNISNMQRTRFEISELFRRRVIPLMMFEDSIFTKKPIDYKSKYEKLAQQIRENKDIATWVEIGNIITPPKQLNNGKFISHSTTSILYNKNEDVISNGISKCSVTDIYNEYFGRWLSLKRAYKNYKNSLTKPQTDEPIYADGGVEKGDAVTIHRDSSGKLIIHRDSSGKLIADKIDSTIDKDAILTITPHINPVDFVDLDIDTPNSKMPKTMRINDHEFSSRQLFIVVMSIISIIVFYKK